MLSSTLPVRFALEFFGPGGLHDGDVLVANDPYHGGGHLPDYNVFAPVFHGGELVLIASIQCHHADTGGGMPGGYNADAPDIWAEGVRFPALKLYERGVERRDLTYFMRVNNRTPTFLGDLRAQVGAAQLGVKRLKAVLARHGTTTVRRAVEEMIELAARALGGGGDTSPGHGGRRGDRQGARAGDPRPLLPTDLQDRHADRDLRHRSAHRAALHRQLGRHDRRALQRRAGPGWLGLDERQLREPDPRHRRDQREHLPAAPARARLRDGQRRGGRVPRRARDALPEAADRAGHRLHLRRRPQVPDARPP